eukprot:4561881-Amphidinium_carterae.1
MGDDTNACDCNLQLASVAIDDANIFCLVVSMLTGRKLKLLTYVKQGKRHTLRLFKEQECRHAESGDSDSSAERTIVLGSCFFKFWVSPQVFKFWVSPQVIRGCAIRAGWQTEPAPPSSKLPPNPFPLLVGARIYLGNGAGHVVI